MIKRTKWAAYSFSAEQERARKMWRSAQSKRMELHSALKASPLLPTRQAYHERLDQILDRIEKTEAQAREQFPEVDQSFTVATGTIPL